MGKQPHAGEAESPGADKRTTLGSDGKRLFGSGHPFAPSPVIPKTQVEDPSMAHAEHMPDGAPSSSAHTSGNELLSQSEPERMGGVRERAERSPERQGASAQLTQGKHKRSASSLYAPAHADRIRDRIGIQVDKLRIERGLSAREAEVAEQIVRGKTAARIAEEFLVSVNTVNTHTRRIYAKLGIHKKVELVELVEGM